ncbi:MAG TPA: VOC family protein [Nocardioidaceae bacterium]|nr:VOC family protein [Nocardioidaceae bacterium]
MERMKEWKGPERAQSWSGEFGMSSVAGRSCGRRPRASCAESAAGGPACPERKLVDVVPRRFYRAEVASRLEAVTFEVADAPTVAAFWAGLLEREILTESGGALVAGDDRQVGLRFVTSDTHQVGPRPLHLHLTSSRLADQRRTVETALSLGGRHIDVGQAPDDAFVVLADPGDNELCVIEPHNNFMAGTGYLGEVTCAGTRDVGLFWRDALDWPLVWDENQETAIQSRLGGTEVSWGGPPVEPKHGRNRQRLDLLTADPSSEAERLVSLGATFLADLRDGVELADPDGNEFGLRAG